MKKPIMVVFLTLGMMIIVNASSYAQLAGLSLNNQATSVQVDPSSGSANISIHLDTPPGRGGIEPNLNLTYSSSNRGLGNAGVGWNLDMGSVTVSLKKGVPKYDGTDGYQLNGLDLIYDTSAAYYRSEIEAGFAKIEKTVNGWMVTDKKGTRYYYGSTDDSRQYDPANQTHIFRWALNKVVDLQGNQMCVAYLRDGNQIYPQSIIYTSNVDGSGNTLIAAHAEIYMSYTAAMYPLQFYNTGFEVVFNKLLSSVMVYAKGTRTTGILQGKYDFVYTASSTNRQRLLTQITRASAGGAVLAPITLSYQDAQPSSAFQLAASASVPTALMFTQTDMYGRVIDQGVRTADVNGDGYPDLIKFSYAFGVLTNQIYLNNKNDGFELSPAWKIPAVIAGPFADINDDGADHGLRFADVNGDGYPDLVWSETRSEGGTWYNKVFINNKVDGWAEDAGWQAPEVVTKYRYPYMANTKPTGVFIADMNGDGYPDFIRMDKNETVVYLNNMYKGTKGWAKADGWSIASNAQYYANAVDNGAILADLNGDGLPDIYYRDSDTDQIWRAGHLFINTGKGFKDEASSVGGWASGGRPGNTKDGTTQLVDVNGDGLSDMMVSFKIGSGGQYALLNPGSAYAPDDWLAAPVSNPWLTPNKINFKNNGHAFMDINGDGAQDILYNFNGAASEIYLNQSKNINILTSIDNGLGVKTSIEYDTALHYNNAFLPFAFPVVKSLTTSIGGNSYKTAYNYSGGKWDAQYREFVGFQKVTVTDPDGNYTRTTFDQRHFYKGRAVESAVYDSADRLMNKSINTWAEADVTADGLCKFIFLKQSDTYNVEGQLTGKRNARQMFYDAEGNIVKNINLGEVDFATGTDILTDDITSTVDYANNGSNGLKGLPKHSKSVDHNGNTLAEAWFYYDGSLDNNAVPTKGQLTRKEDWAGDGKAKNVTKYAYDAVGNLISTTDALNNATGIVYDSSYKIFPVQTVNAKGQTVKTVYYGVNEADVASDPQNNAGLFGLWGQVKAVTDANNNKVFKGYDGFGRNTKAYGPLDSFTLPTTETIYTVTPSYIQVLTKNRINARAAATLDSADYYDGLGRLIQSKRRAAAAGQYVVSNQRTYNARGLVEESFVPQFTPVDFTALDLTPNDTVAHTTFYYDALGRKVKTVNADNSYTNAVYDVNKLTAYDENGHKNVSYFDVFNRLITREEYTGSDGRNANYPAKAYAVYATTFYDYDVKGNLTRVTDAKGNITNITYDALGRKSSMSDPDMHNWTYTYDANGNLICQKDAKSKTLSFIYDSLNRLTLKTDVPQGGVPTTANINVSYDYDNIGVLNSIGRLSKAAYNGAESTQFVYDQLGRETTTTKNINGINYVITRQYDDLNRMVKLTYPDAATNISYVYDAAGQMNGVNKINAQTGAIDVQLVKNVFYNANGQIAKVIFGNGVTTTYTYDVFNFRLTNLVSVNAASNKLQDFAYVYDGVGNILKITDKVNTATQTFKYDDLNRLVQAVGSYGTKAYAYDQIGNITLKDGISYTYGQNGAGPHAVTKTSDGTNYRYDANGNMIGKTTAKGVWTYVYDTENRLTSIGYAPNLKPAKTIANYAYDGDGGRTKKTVYRYLDTDYNNSDTYGVLVTQIGVPVIPAGSSYTTSSTIYVGNLYEMEDARYTKNVYLGNTRVAAITGAEINYYHQDHLGSTNVVTDATGLARSLTEYEPFGKISRFEKYGAKVKDGWYYFHDKAFDDESGLSYFGGRYYDPSLGRFMTPDTIVQAPNNPQTLNRYSYCGNNPVNAIDPTGHKWSWKKFFNSFIGAVVGAAITVLTGGLGAPIAFALGGMVGGAITGGLEGGWKGALMGGLMGGVLGGAVGGGISAFGAGFGYAALAAGGGYAIGTGNADSFLGGLAGGMVGATIGNGIQSYYNDGISVRTPGGGSGDPYDNKNWDVLGIGTTDAKAQAFADQNGSSVFYTRSRGLGADFVRAGMQKVFGNSLASRQFGGYLRGADGFYIAAHSEGTLTMAGAIKGLAVDGVKLPHAQLTFNGPVIMQSTANNLAASIGAPTPRYNLNLGDPIGVFTTLNPVKASLYGITGVPTLATFHSTRYYPDMNVGSN